MPQAHGDEDPFPLRGGRGLRDEFKLSATVSGQTAGTWVKGRGTYVAFKYGAFGEVIATGMTNYLNTEVKLVTSPLTVFPPIYGLFFYQPAIDLPAQKPFRVIANFFSDDPVSKVIVWDADGKHEVPVTQA